MNSRQAEKHFRRRVPGVSEEVKERPEHSRLGLAISGSLQGGSADTTSTSDSTNAGSLFLPGVTPPWTVLQPAPHLTKG